MIGTFLKDGEVKGAVVDTACFGGFDFTRSIAAARCVAFRSGNVIQ